jgi:hypothetical protein
MLKVLFKLILEPGHDRGSNRWQIIEDIPLGGFSRLKMSVSFNGLKDIGEIHTLFAETTTTSSTERSAYARTNSSRTIAVAVATHASSQLASWKYLSLCCGCNTVEQN